MALNSEGYDLAAHPARQMPGSDRCFRAPKSVALLWGPAAAAGDGGP